MAKRSLPKRDINSDAIAMVSVATDTKPPRGEDLIADPKLKKAFREAKKRAAGKKP